MGYISQRKQGKNTYYLYQESYRKKINSNQTGKSRGSGKSNVHSKTIYLGDAEHILNCVKDNSKLSSIKTRHFGLIAAAYQVANKIGLIQILRKHLPGIRYGIPVWIYFFVTIINKLDFATSKNKMSQWLKKTILPELLKFDPQKLSSKSFWYAVDDIISERNLQEKRERGIDEKDVFVGIDDSTFNAIETELFHSIDKLIGLSPAAICYDTTNFYSYIEEPSRSKLAKTCHSKDSKHHLKHVGLLMAVEKSWGIPLVSRIYRANSHDSKLFSFIVSDLIISLKNICGADSNLVLVLDKGNNSEANFGHMNGNISWVGSLVPSHYEDLMELELNEYHGDWKGCRFYRCTRNVMGIDCTIALTFNSASMRKKEHSMQRGIEKLKDELLKKWEGYKKKSNKIPKGISTMADASRYGACLKVMIKKENLCFEINDEEIQKRRKHFGKNLIFSNMLHVETGYLIDTYCEKNVIETDFQLLKDTNIIRFRPIRHWTDSKIRAYAFCCILSMTLIRVMQYLVEQAGYKMSPNLLKEELMDLQEVIIVYSLKKADRKITDRSSVQNRLWDIFEMEKIKDMLSLH